MYLLKDEFFLSPHKARKQEKETKSKHNQINILFAELRESGNRLTNIRNIRKIFC